jgi:hypothetical protein
MKEEADEKGEMSLVCCLGLSLALSLTYGVLSENSFAWMPSAPSLSNFM